MTDNFDTKKVEKLTKKLHKIFNDTKPTIQEILVAYGNLGYHLGASMAGFEGTGPDIQTLRHYYYSNPTVDVGLMLQGLTITTWETDFTKQPKISNLAKLYNKQQEEKGESK